MSGGGDSSSEDAWGDWTCLVCSRVNSMNDVKCMGCNKRKNKSRKHTAASPAPADRGQQLMAEMQSMQQLVHAMPEGMDADMEFAYRLQCEELLSATNGVQPPAAPSSPPCPARHSGPPGGLGPDTSQKDASRPSAHIDPCSPLSDHEVARLLQEADEKEAKAARDARAQDEDLARMLYMQDQEEEKERQRQQERDAELAREQQRKHDSDYLELRRMRDLAAAESIRMMLQEEDAEREGDQDLARTLQEEEGGLSARCRFCDSLCFLPESHKHCAAFCTKDDCQRGGRIHCMMKLRCGHPCCGIRNEVSHISKCGVEGCDSDGVVDCPICLDGIKESPCVELACGHIYHHGCLLHQINNGVAQIGPGKKFSFAMFRCAHCQDVLEGPAIEKEMEPLKKNLDLIYEQARKTIVKEKDADLSAMMEDPLREREFKQMALKTFTFYQCKEPRCLRVFCGGRQACGEAGDEDENYDQAQCPECELNQQRMKPCSEHSADDMMRKCDFCCATAVFRCNLGSAVYFCDACHSHPFQKRTPKPCDPRTCALSLQGKEHPGGTRTHGFIIGCQKCFEMHLT
eukprot:TRINITY_DN25873_c0_g1_i1.p1 TRINITY_DN25873_c0_g1~~TRINITY_DN25873_c0_g1_i1.p1  ORF type:complete len:573 (+),score=175.13 TRINITY_DN25873_c0_g1_i1:144-1862(+)